MLKLFYRLDATVLINERNLICITKMDGASTATRFFSGYKFL